MLYNKKKQKKPKTQKLLICIKRVARLVQKMPSILIGIKPKRGLEFFKYDEVFFNFSTYKVLKAICSFNEKHHQMQNFSILNHSYLIFAFHYNNRPFPKYCTSWPRINILNIEI